MSKDKITVLEAKTELGEAGPVWWNDGQPDLSGQNPANTPYANWWSSLTETERQAGM